MPDKELYAVGGATLRTLLLLGVATVTAFALLGYHPYAEDGGIYDAAIAAYLHPHLFPHDHTFVVAHTRFSLFTPLVGSLAHLTHLPLPWLLLVLQITLLAALLGASAHLARTCFPQVPSWTGGLFVAAGAGLPVAGTALYAVDPYCTARSFTTPLLLFAFSFALRRRASACAVLWCAAAAVHPLMAFWSAVPLVFLMLDHPSNSPAARRRSILENLLLKGLLFAALGIACAAVAQSLATPETALARTAALTRAYWFPAEWHWYEWLGAWAPPALLLVMTHCVPWNRHRPEACVDAPPGRCARACSMGAALAIVLALLFARESARSLLIARLQPLRTLHLVFVVFLALCGPWLWQAARAVRGSGRLIATGAIAVCVGAMGVSSFAMQRSLYRSTRHSEWPGLPARNGWDAAFLWCRRNTPEDALFALPPHYIDLPGEDARSFRATALRSALPDAVKDAGVVAVLPVLASAWGTALAATANLDTETDAERRALLLPLGVTWVVMPVYVQTALRCPFLNSEVRVCRLRPLN